MPSEHPAANDRVSLGIKPNLLAMSWFSLSPNVEMPILPIRISLPDLAATFASPLKASALSLLAQTLHVLEQSNEWQISKQQTNKQTNKQKTNKQTHTHTQKRVVTIYDGKANISRSIPNCCLGPAMLTLCWRLVPENMPI